jgi:hypothetical protein
VQNFNLKWESFRLMLLKEERLNKISSDMANLSGLRELFEEIDAQKEPVESYVFTGDFWDEEGSDSDGYWHESDTSTSTDFILDEAGKYYIYLEVYSSRQREVRSLQISMEQVKSYRYFLIAMAIFMVLLFVNKTKAKSYNELPFDMA